MSLGLEAQGRGRGFLLIVARLKYDGDEACPPAIDPRRPPFDGKEEPLSKLFLRLAPIPVRRQATSVQTHYDGHRLHLTQRGL